MILDDGPPKILLVRKLDVLSSRFERVKRIVERSLISERRENLSVCLRYSMVSCDGKEGEDP